MTAGKTIVIPTWGRGGVERLDTLRAQALAYPVVSLATDYRRRAGNERAAIRTFTARVLATADAGGGGVVAETDSSWWRLPGRPADSLARAEAVRNWLERRAREADIAVATIQLGRNDRVRLLDVIARARVVRRLDEQVVLEAEGRLGTLLARIARATRPGSAGAVLLLSAALAAPAEFLRGSGITTHVSGGRRLHRIVIATEPQEVLRLTDQSSLWACGGRQFVVQQGRGWRAIKGGQILPSYALDTPSGEIRDPASLTGKPLKLIRASERPDEPREHWSRSRAFRADPTRRRRQRRLGAAGSALCPGGRTLRDALRRARPGPARDSPHTAADKR